jgi:hypothetical protein
MPRSLLLSVIIGVIVLASPAKSQARLGAGTGIVLPVSDLGHVDQVGYNLDVSLQSISQLATFGFRADVMFAAMARKATIQDISERIFSVTMGPMIRRPGLQKSFPYLVGGLGIYNQSTSPQPVGGTSSTDIGFNAGAGARFTFGKRVAYVEARYHDVSSVGGARFVPVMFGLVF